MSVYVVDRKWKAIIKWSTHSMNKCAHSDERKMWIETHKVQSKWDTHIHSKHMNTETHSSKITTGEVLVVCVHKNFDRSLSCTDDEKRRKKRRCVWCVCIWRLSMWENVHVRPKTRRTRKREQGQSSTSSQSLTFQCIEFHQTKGNAWELVRTYDSTWAFDVGEIKQNA